MLSSSRGIAALAEFSSGELRERQVSIPKGSCPLWGPCMGTGWREPPSPAPPEQWVPGSARPMQPGRACRGPPVLAHAQGAPAVPVPPCSPTAPAAGWHCGSHTVPCPGLAAEPQKELSECLLKLPQPRWAEQGCLTGFQPAGLVWCCLAACWRDKCIFWFCWQQLSCGMSCSAPLGCSLALGQLLGTHSSVLVPPGRARTSSAGPSSGEVPGHVVPGGSALLCCPGDAHPKGSSGSVLGGQNLSVLMPGMASSLSRELCQP